MAAHARTGRTSSVQPVACGCRTGQAGNGSSESRSRMDATSSGRATGQGRRPPDELLRASFLLDWNGRGGAFVYQPTRGADPWNGAWTRSIGLPRKLRNAVSASRGTADTGPRPRQPDTACTQSPSRALGPLVTTLTHVPIASRLVPPAMPVKGVKPSSAKPTDGGKSLVDHSDEGVGLPVDPPRDGLWGSRRASLFWS
jgi:hypothetical protein